MYHSCCYHSWCYRLNKFYYSASDSKNGSFANVVAYSGTSLMYLELTNSLFNGWSGNAWILRLIEFSFIETNNVHEMNTEPQFLRYSKSDGTKVIKLYTFICMTFHWTWNVMHNIHFIDSLICMTFISLTIQALCFRATRKSTGLVIVNTMITLLSRSQCPTIEMGTNAYLRTTGNGPISVYVR